MTGRKQHHIPRLVLRGFLTDHTGRTEKVWVVRKGGRIHVSPIEDVATERDFYSSPSGDGSKTLDDYITEYENRLAGLVTSLRELSVGDQADPEIASEILAHLAPRAASIRSFFERGLKGLIAGASSALADPENVSQLLGLDLTEPNERFRGHFKEAITQHLRVHQSDVPFEFIERLVFVAVQERFSGFFEQQIPDIQTLLVHFTAIAGQSAKVGHNRVLQQSLVVERRQEDLRSFDWKIVRAPAGGAVLPDCVALSTRSDGKFTPYIISDREDVTAIVTPLTSDKLLLGLKSGASWPELESYNEHAAACSVAFVVCSNRPAAAERLSFLIGERSDQFLDEVVAAAISDSVIARRDNFTGDPELRVDNEHAASVPPTYQITFLACADQNTAEKISDVVRYVVNRYAQSSPLRRLDGITFAADYPAALRELDRGFKATQPLGTISDDIGIGYAQAPIVVRDGIIKVRIIMRAEYAHALIGEDINAAEFGLHALVFELAEAAFIEQLDTTLPDVLLTAITDQHDGPLYAGVNAAITSYFATRGSAGFGADDQHEMILRTSLSQALAQAQCAIEAGRAAYLEDNDVGKFYSIGLDSVAHILALCASLLGHRIGLELPIFVPNDPLEAKLTSLGLRSWLDVFERDLRTLWIRRGRWASHAEFIALKRHTERLLWQFGIYPWRLADGQSYVRFALG